MVLILMSIAGTAILLVMQFIEFVRQEYLDELSTKIRSVPRRLLGSVESLTLTVPVAVTYR